MKRKKKKRNLLGHGRLSSFDIKIAPVHNKKNVNTDTTVHLAHVQAFFYKLESLAGENIILLYLFGKKNNKITSRCLSNFKGPIVSYFSPALSCEQRPFFVVARLLSEILLSFVIVKSDRLNKSKVESGKPAKTRAS